MRSARPEDETPSASAACCGVSGSVRALPPAGRLAWRAGGSGRASRPPAVATVVAVRAAVAAVGTVSAAAARRTCWRVLLPLRRPPARWGMSASFGARHRASAHRWPPALHGCSAVLHRRPAVGCGSSTLRHRPATRHSRRSRMGSARRPHTGRQAAMGPLVAARIPGTSPIVVVPVGKEREGDDRQAEMRSVGVERHPLSLVYEGQAPRIDPASAAVERCVAPAPIAQASVDVERRALAQLRHQRVVAVGSGPHVHRPGSERVLRARNAENSQHQRADRSYE